LANQGLRGVINNGHLGDDSVASTFATHPVSTETR
jgi:hypothetical protein